MAVHTTNAPITLAPLMRRIEAWRERARLRREVRRTCAELSALSDRDLADLGLSRCDLPTVARRAVYR